MAASSHYNAGPNIVVRPLVVTLALHAAVIFAMTAHWESEPDVTITPKKVTRVIDATLIDAEALKPKPKPKPVEKPKPKPKAQSKPKPVEKPKPKPKVEPKPQPKVEPKPEPKVEPKPEPALTPEELAAIARDDLAKAVEEEAEQSAAQQQALSESQMADSYAALIQSVITNNWSRPPSARNGMEVLLSLQLIPTGEVINVTVLRSSGDAAFDRSAINAVEKADRFPELQKLPPRVFERQFRRFRLLFKPEDLRY